jgi:hypothetical protein
MIRETAQIGGHIYEGTWTVAEYAYPFRVVLRGASDRIQISYTFRPLDNQTSFVRKLEYRPEDFGRSAGDAAALQALMERQSAEALVKLRDLVERVLKEGAASHP